MEVTDNRAIGKGVSVSVRLTDGEIQQIAERLVELLPRHVSGERLIDAAEVARRLGISRSTVYEKAEDSARSGSVRAGGLGFASIRSESSLSWQQGAALRSALRWGPDDRRRPADASGARSTAPGFCRSEEERFGEPSAECGKRSLGPGARDQPRVRSEEMAPNATGEVLQRRRGGIVVYALRFRAYGKRRYLTLGTKAEGWSRARADEELQNVLAEYVAASGGLP